MNISNIPKDQIDENTAASNYNTALINSYINESKISVAAFVVIWIVFLIECVWTYEQGYEQFGVKSISPMVLDKMGGNIPWKVMNGQVYRLFLPMILHAGILHICMNSSALIVFCTSVEKKVGWRLYLSCYIFGGMQGIMLFDLYNKHFGNINALAIGASTSVCAVMGLYMATIYLWSKVHGRTEMAIKEIASMLLYVFILSLFPGIDFFGHFGSIISGALIGLSFVEMPERVNIKQLRLFSKIGLGVYTLILFSIFI